MRKLLFYFTLLLFFGSCMVPYDTSKNQLIVIRKFSLKKNIRPHRGPKYVKPYRRGVIMDKSVRKPTRKDIKQNIKRERHTKTD